MRTASPAPSSGCRHLLPRGEGLHLEDWGI